MRRGLFGWKTTVNLYSLLQKYLQVIRCNSTVRESLPPQIAKVNAGIDVVLTSDVQRLHRLPVQGIEQLFQKVAKK